MVAPVVGLAILAGIDLASKAYAQSQQASARDEALTLQGQQLQIQYQQKSLSNLATMQKVLDAQIAQATVRGYGLDSPSFGAIQANTLNIGARTQSNLELEKTLVDQNLDIERHNVRSALYAQLFGDVADTGYKFYNVYNKLPVGG